MSKTLLIALRPEFSRRAYEWIEGMKDVGAVITLYDRLLTPPMIGKLEGVALS